MSTVYEIWYDIEYKKFCDCKLVSLLMDENQEISPIFLRCLGYEYFIFENLDLFLLFSDQRLYYLLLVLFLFWCNFCVNKCLLFISLFYNFE